MAALLRLSSAGVWFGLGHSQSLAASHSTFSASPRQPGFGVWRSSVDLFQTTWSCGSANLARSVTVKACLCTGLGWPVLCVRPLSGMHARVVVPLCLQRLP